MRIKALIFTVVLAFSSCEPVTSLVTAPILMADEAKVTNYDLWHDQVSQIAHQRGYDISRDESYFREYRRKGYTPEQAIKHWENDPWPNMGGGASLWRKLDSEDRLWFKKNHCVPIKCDDNIHPGEICAQPLNGGAITHLSPRRGFLEWMDQCNALANYRIAYDDGFGDSSTDRSDEQFFARYYRNGETPKQAVENYRRDYARWNGGGDP
jgi:hypothetical protein